jgi:hypothetical protein
MFTTQKIKPYGLLKIGNQEWFLLRPEPLPAESWQYPLERRWSVVSTQSEKWEDDHYVYNPVRLLITADPSLIIELIPDIQPIYVKNVPLSGDEDFQNQQYRETD